MSSRRHNGLVQRMKRFCGFALACAILASLFCGLGLTSARAEASDGEATQTPVESADFIFEDGVPKLDIEGVGVVEHPAYTALYALGYMGAETYYDLNVEPSDAYARNCVEWLKANASGDGDTKGWAYAFDNTYNDVTIRAPWYSAFGNACGIEALVEWYRRTGDEEALELARQCARMLTTPIAEGGLMFEADGDIWFEEIPTPDAEPSHILNGHMRACIALKALCGATGDETLDGWYRKGIAALERWLPLYDSGYFLRYDLNPRKTELLFRINTPSGEALPQLAIDSIRLTDPLTGESVSIDAGNAPGDMDPASGCYLAGLDWQEESLPDDRTVRRLVASEPQSDYNASGVKPNSYFYLNLPGEWTNNLRQDWFELTLVYRDEAPGNAVVEMRSIGPDEEFVALRDGDLLLTGSWQWREWTVPLRPSDLGWPVGTLYAEKHMRYLGALAEDSEVLRSWTDTARAYYNGAMLKVYPDSVIEGATHNKGYGELDLNQNVPLPLFSPDENGVALQHYRAIDSVYLPDYDLPTEGTKGYYSPYIIAEQALKDAAVLEVYNGRGDISALAQTYPYYGEYNWILKGETEEKAPSEAAYKWLRENALSVGDGYVWHMDTDNCYNDVVQKSGWQSAFWQRYIIDAFIADGDEEMARKAAYAYGVPTAEGGLCSVARDGTLWFEEVPNDTHILNANLASLVALHSMNDAYPDPAVRDLYDRGVRSLRESLYRYDTGYWTKYDLNPRKDLLFELEWEGNTDSPEIDTIWCYNPAADAMTELNVGDEGDAEGNCRISGLRWMQSWAADGRMARRIAKKQAGDEANSVAAYFHMTLPECGIDDDFQLPSHYIVIRYKDSAEGILTLRGQSIADGNQLVTLPIRQGWLACAGNGEWRTAVIELRPQDMGWSMGIDYQKYHNEQLALIAEQTGDWYFRQAVERWGAYLDAQTVFDPRGLKTEGKNKVIFVEGDLRPAYIEDTGWRAQERAVESEDCALTLVSASEGLDEGQVTRFLVGDVEALTLSPGQSFLVALKEAHWLDSLSMKVNGDYPVELCVADANGQNIYYKTTLLDEEPLPLEPEVLCAYLRVAYPETAAAPASISALSMSGKPSLYAQIVRALGEDAAVLGEKDPTNPLSIYRFPLRQSVYKLAERLLNGHEDLTPHQKAMVFMDYISDWYVGNENSAHYLALDTSIEACGGYSNVLAALAATQGLEARIITLGNYPPSNGHAVCEVFYNDSWHLYDPTFGAYYTTSYGNSVLPDVLSYDALANGRGNREDVYCVVTSPNRIVDANSYGFLGPRIYETANPRGPIGPDKPMTYPLTMALGEGEITSAQFGTDRQGISYIGAASINNLQLWTLTGLKAGETYCFRVTGEWVGGDNPGSFSAFAASEDARLEDDRHEFSNNNPDSMVWEITLTAGGDTAHILLSHDHRGPDYCYISFHSFALDRVGE